MSYEAEFASMLERVRAFGVSPPTLVLHRTNTGPFDASRARLVSGAVADRILSDAHAVDPVLQDGGKELRRMRVAGVARECRRLGLDPVRPGATKRLHTKRDLISLLLSLRPPPETERVSSAQRENK